MNGWVQLRRGGPWHQVEYDNRTERATLLCDGSTYPLDRDYMAWGDYRSNPFPKCKKKACQAEVEP